MSPLYAIVDVDVCARAGATPEHVARACLAGGARVLQIRAKSLSSGALLRLVDQVASAARAVGALVIVNDRVDVARTAAVGVHLGQDDLPVTVARVLLGPDAVIGLSTHTLAQLAQAVTEPVTYVAYGPVFATTTKLNPDPAVGLDGLRAAAALATAAGKPLVAIGGITLATASAVRHAGATSMAVISDLLTGFAPEARVRLFLSVLGSTPPV